MAYIVNALALTHSDLLTTHIAANRYPSMLRSYQILEELAFVQQAISASMMPSTFNV